MEDDFMEMRVIGIDLGKSVFHVVLGKPQAWKSLWRFPLYSLPLRRMQIRFPTEVCLGQTRMAEQSNGVSEACGTKRFSGNRDRY
jgi:hypothetical protein